MQIERMTNLLTPLSNTDRATCTLCRYSGRGSVPATASVGARRSLLAPTHLCESCAEGCGKTCWDCDERYYGGPDSECHPDYCDDCRPDLTCPLCEEPVSGLLEAGGLLLCVDCSAAEDGIAEDEGLGPRIRWGLC